MDKVFPIVIQGMLASLVLVFASTGVIFVGWAVFFVYYSESDEDIMLWVETAFEDANIWLNELAEEIAESMDWLTSRDLDADPNIDQYKEAYGNKLTYYTKQPKVVGFESWENKIHSNWKIK